MYKRQGAFFVVILVSNRLGGEMIENYRNLISRAPLLAVSMALFLFSLTGLPPLAGFSGKWLLFTAALEGGLYWLVVVAALNSAVSLYYYIRVVRAMFFEKSDEETPLTFTFANQLLLLFFAVPTVLLFVFWEPSYQVIETVIRGFTPDPVSKITATISQ